MRNAHMCVHFQALLKMVLQPPARSGHGIEMLKG
jgi:hypothetical protein